jgi:gamma-glutamylcyclotransferase (GGCT)/AIG2-like uncharacterized protein YtfP
MDRLPEAWIAPPAVRDLREAVRHRAKLVALRSGLKAQVHAVLAKQGVVVPVSDLFGAGGQALLDRLRLDPPYAARVGSLRRLIDAFSFEIDIVGRRVAAQLAGHPGYTAVQAIAGVGPVLAAVFVAEIGEVGRFTRPSGSGWGGAWRLCGAGDTGHRSSTRAGRLGVVRLGRSGTGRGRASEEAGGRSAERSCQSHAMSCQHRPADSHRDGEPGLDVALRCLATYGSLAPGRPNHHQLEGLEGRWSRGHVHGTVVDAGWGASLGYPALILDPDGTPIEVHVFESVDLPAHWSRLDRFEGPGYRRVATTVHTTSDDVDAFIYVLAAEDGS